jgi:hypothetical protein
MMTVSVVGDRAEADLATQPTTGRLTTGRLPKTGRLPNGLAAELTKSFVSLWTQYAGKQPTNARTEIRGNVVTCVLVERSGTTTGA